jgi:O-antigen/teichoic acid export membrane protein
MFLVNVALARTQTKEEYGMFALSYSVFTFLSGVHNASILEPYTVYGSGRYRDHFSDYLRLMARANALVGFLLSAILLLACLCLWRWAPQFASRALLGLGLTIGVLLSGIFLRRACYVLHQPRLAAGASLLFFLTVASALWLAVRAHVLNDFSAFLILALGWMVAAASPGRRLPLGKTPGRFLELEPRYWGVHWNYARWVLVTAFVFQLMTQGYYWLVAGFLSAKEVGELRAMYNLVAPIEQVFIALSFVLLPALAARYASGRTQDFLSLQKRYGLVVLTITTSFVLAVRIAGKPIMHFLYAGKFDDLSPLLYVLAFLPIMTGMNGVIGNGLNAAEKPRLVFYAYVCSGVTTFLAGIPFVLHLGLQGAVYGMLLSGAACTVALALGFFLIVYRKANRSRLS